MLEDIRKDITRLIALYEGEKQRSDELAIRLQQSEEAAKSYREQIGQLTRQIDSLKLSSAFAASGPTPEAKARLDRIIAEIDKCIKLLES